MLKATSGHTATNRGRRVTIHTIDGGVISGKFIERRHNSRIVIEVDGERVELARHTIAKFICGRGTRKNG